MATTERAQEYVRNFRMVHLDTHCKRDTCHGTHVDRIDWEIALRHIQNEKATLELENEFEDADQDLMLWVNYLFYCRMRYSSKPPFRPPFKRSPTSTDLLLASKAGITPEELENICWVCDHPDCRICTVPDGSARGLRHYLLLQRSKKSFMDFKNGPI